MAHGLTEVGVTQLTIWKSSCGKNIFLYATTKDGVDLGVATGREYNLVLQNNSTQSGTALPPLWVAFVFFRLIDNGSA